MMRFFYEMNFFLIKKIQDLINELQKWSSLIKFGIHSNFNNFFFASINIYAN